MALFGIRATGEVSWNQEEEQAGKGRIPLGACGRRPDGGAWLAAPVRLQARGQRKQRSAPPPDGRHESPGCWAAPGDGGQ